MTTTIVILTITALLFVWDKYRSDVVALIALLAFSLLGILTPEEALSGFSNPIVLMLAGLFIISGALNQTGLAQTISMKLFQMAGKNELRLFMLTMLISAFFGTFMANYGTVVLLLPIVVAMTREAEMSTRRFLMPMAFASSMGGMMTLIGTPANLIVDDALARNGLERLDFFTLMPIGLVLLGLGLFFLWKFSGVLEKDDKKPSRDSNVKTPNELVREYQLSENLFRIKMNPFSPLVGKKLIDINITHKYNVSIIEIRSLAHTSGKFFKSVYQHLAHANTILYADDIIYVTGKFEDVERFVQENKLKFLDTSHTENHKRPEFTGKMKFDEIGIAEAVVLSSSKLVDKLVKDSGFRKRFNINILGIKRQKEYILNKVQDVKIQSGDSLLIQGSWDNIKELDYAENDLIIVGHPEQEASKVTLEHKSTTAGIILLGMIIVMVFDVIEPVIAVMSSAVLMIFFRCFKNAESAYDAIKWQNIVFLSGMIPLAIAMNKTGTSNAITSGLINVVGNYGPQAVLAVLYIITSLLTMFISSTATVVFLVPIAIQSATALGANPYPFLFAVATAATMCLGSPYASPTNSLVMSPGRYSLKDYLKVGLPLQVIYFVVMVFILPLFYPF